MVERLLETCRVMREAMIVASGGKRGGEQFTIEGG
jgi:hypothetical protein